MERAPVVPPVQQLARDLCSLALSGWIESAWPFIAVWNSAIQLHKASSSPGACLTDLPAHQGLKRSLHSYVVESHLTQGMAGGGASGMQIDDTSDSCARLAASLSCCCLPAAPYSAGANKFNT